MSLQLPETTVVESTLSDIADTQTAQQVVTSTPTLLHLSVPPTHLARHETHEEQEQEQTKLQTRIAGDGIITIIGTRIYPLAITTTTPLDSIETITTSSRNGTTTTTLTMTRAHRPAHTSTATSYIDQWPQIGFVPSESDIPRQWRETYETKALRQQYIALGAICGILVVGVLGVLAFAVWKCFHEGRTGRRERIVESEGKWDWF